MKIILMSGPSAAGKSAVAKQLSEKTGYKVISDRQVLDTITEWHGYKRVRDCINGIGLQPLLEEGRIEMTKRIILASRGKGMFDFGCNGVIIDGAYDGMLPDYLKRSFVHSQITIVKVSANMRMRLHRMAKRKGITEEQAKLELKFYDQTKMRMGAISVSDRASVSVKNFGTLDNTLMDMQHQFTAINEGIPGMMERASFVAYARSAYNILASMRSIEWRLSYAAMAAYSIAISVPYVGEFVRHGHHMAMNWRQHPQMWH